jgi:hypothetical protein
MDSIVTQGVALGCRGYVMTGGEPMVRKDDIMKSCQEAHQGLRLHDLHQRHAGGSEASATACGKLPEHRALHEYRGTMRRRRTARRGKGTFQKIMKTMDLLRANKLALYTVFPSATPTSELQGSHFATSSMTS